MKIVILSLFIFTQVEATTINSFIKAFVQNNAKLAQLNSEVNEVKSELDVAKSKFYPQVSFNAGYLDSTTPASTLGLSIPGLKELKSKNYSATLNIDQVLYAGGRIYNSVKLRQAQTSAKELEVQIQKQVLTQKALISLLRYKFSDESINVLKDSLKTQTRFLGLVQRRVRSGLARSFEYDQTLSEKTAYELRIEQVEQQKSILLLSLMTDTGFTEKEITDIQLPNIAALKISTSPVDISKNWEYKGLLAQEKMLGSQQALEKSEDLPSLSVGGSIGRQGPQLGDLTDKDFKTSNLYVNLSVPLFSGFSSFKRRSKTQSIKYSIEKNKSEIKKNIGVNSRQLLVRLQKNKTLLEKNEFWKKTAKRGLSRVLSAYRLGQVENSQIVQMQSVYERASVSYLDLLELYYKDYVAWHFIQGHNIEEVF